MPSATLRTPHASFSLLFARYVRGEIGDAIWTNLMELLDAADVDTNERLAFARFASEVVSESGPSALRIPRDQEARDILIDTRPDRHPSKTHPDRTISSV